METRYERIKHKVAVFDFDGTLSTLRAGWEKVMATFMREMIVGDQPMSADEESILEAEIEQYINRSAGIQTIYQMRWLKERVLEKGRGVEGADEWAYKAAFNQRLIEQVRLRTEQVLSGQHKQEDYLIKGSRALLQALQDAGIDMYLASGTDHPDVVREAELLGVASYFKQIAGAPLQRVQCSKEKVIADLLQSHADEEVALYVIGDGKVEIGLGRAYGGRSLGLASDEWRREGINPIKKERLLQAGAHWIVGDYLNLEQWLLQFGLQTGDDDETE